MQGTRRGSTGRLEMMAKALPEDVVEKILSMTPFPDIVKVRVLNRSWNVKLSRASTEALAFQNQVKALSFRWNHYCPIIFNFEKEWLVGYDRDYKQWQTIPLGFDKEGLGTSCLHQIMKLRGAGSLMCGVSGKDPSLVFVTNIVSGTWKWLPLRPDMTTPRDIHLLPIGSDAYQVLLITKEDRDPFQVSCQLYDSTMESWTIKQSRVKAVFDSSAYLDGVLYVMGHNYDVIKVLSYNVKDGIWTNRHCPFVSMVHEIETYELLVCQNQIMVVLHLRPNGWPITTSDTTRINTLMVYRLDPISLDVTEVARGPPWSTSASCSLFASDDESIYFGDPLVAGSSVVQVNLQSNEWKCLPPPPCAHGYFMNKWGKARGSFKNKWATFSFQPGLNPFVSV